MPNLVGILSDAVVRCKHAAGSSVHKRLLRPLLLVAIVLDSILVSVHIGLKISKTHEGVGNTVACVDEVVSDMREVLTADGTVESVNNALKCGRAVIVISGAVAVSPKLLMRCRFRLCCRLFFLSFSAENPLFSAFVGFGLLLMALPQGNKKRPRTGLSK